MGARSFRGDLDTLPAPAYPADRLEVLVVDGQSSDGTANIVREYAAQHPLVRLLDNPRRVVPTALNLGIQAASGEIIARMDAHVVYPPEYLPRLVQGLQEHHVDNIGGGVGTLPAGGTRGGQATAPPLGPTL